MTETCDVCEQKAHDYTIITICYGCVRRNMLDKLKKKED